MLSLELGLLHKLHEEVPIIESNNKLYQNVMQQVLSLRVSQIVRLHRKENHTAFNMFHTWYAELQKGDEL